MYINNLIGATRRQHALEAFRRLNAKARLSRLFARNGGLADLDEAPAPFTTTRVARGLKDIPVERITGSLGRASDFDRDFRPLKKHLRDRWIRNYLDLQTDSWAPIRVHQVGRDYFVEDGHHRVSVARYAGMAYIQAEVWEYVREAAPAPAPVRPRPRVEPVVRSGPAGCACETHPAR
jgi:hypothetical protein